MKITNIIGGHLLAANVAAPETRDMMFYGGTAVLREDGRGKLFHLSFSMEPDAVDLSLLNSGRAPFVRDHIENIDHQLGVIERAWLEGGHRATIRFSARDEMRGLIGDITSGVLANISMGATISKISKAAPVEKGMGHLMATRWQPFHLSLVSRGADHTAQFLSDCRMEIPAELLDSISELSGAASEAENSDKKARQELAIRARRFRVFGR